MPTNNIPDNQHSISLQTAVDMTLLYRQNRENILADDFKSQNILPLSETFNKGAFEAFFNDNNCKAIRIYYGMDENYKVHAILVGVNQSNEDILPQSSSLSENNDNDIKIMELAFRCPPDPYCPSISVLNTP